MNNFNIINHSIAHRMQDSGASSSNSQLRLVEPTDEQTVRQLGADLSRALLEHEDPRNHAQKLLNAMVPEQKVIDLDGVAVHRKHIKDIADGSLPLSQAELDDLKNIKNELQALDDHLTQGWDANVHIGGLLSGGARTLRKLKVLNQGSLPDLDSVTRTIKSHLTNNEEAIKGLDHALSLAAQVNEHGLNTNIKEVIIQVWTYCSRHSDEGMRQNLIDAFVRRLNEIGNDKPCNTGCVQRLLQTMEGIDPNFKFLPDKDAIQQEIMSLLGLDGCALDIYLDAEIEKRNIATIEDAIRFKQIQMKASIERILVQWRGIPESLVAEAMCKPLDDVEANDLFMKNTSYGDLDASYRNYRDETALMRAVVKNDMQSVQAELTKLAKLTASDQAAYLNQTDSQGMSALYLAADNGHAEVVGKLLEAGFDVNQLSYDGGTALRLAAQNGHVEVVGKLLEAEGINVNLADQWGKTALYLAAQNGHAEVVGKLLGVPEINANLADRWGRTALHSAAENGHVEVVGKLLEARVDVNLADQWGKTALHSAAENGHVEVVGKLLEARVDVNLADQWGKTALHSAAENGHVEVVGKLLEAEGINVNLAYQWGKTALHIAAARGDADLVGKLLAAEGINVNLADQSGKTALHIAAARGDADLVGKLLEARVDVNLADRWGATALQLAAQMRRQNVVDLFVVALSLSTIQVSNKGT